MLTEVQKPAQSSIIRLAAAPRGLWRLIHVFARKHPYVTLFFIIIGSNLFGSLFNISYNLGLIVERLLDEAQKAVFKNHALPIYNLVAYPLGLVIAVCVLLPLVRCRRLMRANQEVPAKLLETARRRLLNLPVFLILIDLLLWLPGIVFFPVMICTLGSTHEFFAVWSEFFLSFAVSALITAAQTFFLMEWFLKAVLYADFFRDTRPAEIEGVIKIPFWLRLMLLWCAVALMPLVALLVVALNRPIEDNAADIEVLHGLAWSVAAVGILSSGFISWIVGYDLLYWLRTYGWATEQIRRENFGARIPEKRPDEWGRLNDRFNDMASGLETGRRVHDMFGQFVGFEARGEMFEMLSQLGGQVRDITVMFLDIRGFTRRSAGEQPERVVQLLNEFLTMAVSAIENNNGMVNKFLGDGLMALFGHPPDWRADHADLAVRAATDLVSQLEDLNQRLAQRGEQPLRVGIGIHSGPALVGCIGATMVSPDGRERIRKELTAIGETVNLCQRVEQLTKTCGGPVLISGQTRQRLKAPPSLVDLGVQALERSNESLHIFEVRT